MFTDQPWLRLPSEPVAAFHGFAHFRDALGISIDAAWREHAVRCDQKGLNEVSHRRRPTSWARWSVIHDWIGRRDAYLRHLDEERRRKFLKEQQAATERHLRMVMAGQQTLAMQLKASLEATQGPTAQAELKNLYTGAAGLLRALADGREACRLIPSVVQCERLILGLTTSIDEARDEHRDELMERSRVIADRITSSPHLSSLAVDLVHEIAMAERAAENADSSTASAPPGDDVDDGDD